MTDREQIRRDAEAALSAHRTYTNTPSFAADCLALLAELEQAERLRDDYRHRLLDCGRDLLREERRAKQAERERDELRKLFAEAAKGLRHLPQAWIACTELNALDDALADWERKGDG